jgi:hypothetical protein
MENELKEGTLATFSRSQPSLCLVWHRLCAAPMPVTTPQGPEAGGPSSSILAGDTYREFSWPRGFWPPSQHQLADGGRRDPRPRGRCPGQLHSPR